MKQFWKAQFYLLPYPLKPPFKIAPWEIQVEGKTGDLILLSKMLICKEAGWVQGEAERPPQWDAVQGLRLTRAQYLKAKATSYPWNQLSPNDHRWYFDAFFFPKCQSSHTVSGPKDNSVCTCPSPFLRQITHSRFTTRWINELPDLGENISAWLLHTAFSFPLPLVLWLGLSLLQPELCRTFPLEMPSVSIFPTSYSFSTPLRRKLFKEATAQPGWSAGMREITQWPNLW